MRDVNVIAIECMRELENIGIKCGNVIKIDVNTRSKKRWGQCRKIGNNYIIEVNQILRDSADEKGISEEQKEKIQKERTATRKVEYIFKCTCCGQKVERCRESKFTKYPELYRCAVCHGKFERIF